MAAGSTYTQIASTTLGSATSSVTFSSIPATYTDLILVVDGTNSADGSLYLRANSDFGANYSSTFIYGNGASAVSGKTTSVGFALSGRMSAAQSVSIAHIMNYANTSTYKTILARGNSNGLVIAEVSLWRSTAAINALTTNHDAGTNFSVGTTFNLYGITAA